MPKTKLNRPRLTPAQIRARIVRSAADRVGMCRDRDLADILSLSGPGMSSRLNGTRPWRLDDLTVLAARIDLTDDEIVRFVRGQE